MIGPDLERLLWRMSDAGICVYVDRYGRMQIRQCMPVRVQASAELMEEVRMAAPDIIAYIREEKRIVHCIGCARESHCDGDCQARGGFVPRV